MEDPSGSEPSRNESYENCVCGSSDVLALGVKEKCDAKQHLEPATRGGHKNASL